MQDVMHVQSGVAKSEQVYGKIQCYGFVFGRFALSLCMKIQGLFSFFYQL